MPRALGWLTVAALSAAVSVSCRTPPQPVAPEAEIVRADASGEAARQVVVEELQPTDQSVRTPPRPEQVRSAAAPTPRPAPPEEALPAYRRLAYRPAEPTPITELPATFYTVQLMAVSTKESLETFVRERQLRSLSAARIESGGALYYVLLLGVYPNAEAAEQAAADLPPGLEEASRWVRSLGSIQEGIERANRLTGSAEF